MSSYKYNTVFNKFTRFSGACSANEIIDFLGIRYMEPYITIPKDKKDGLIETSYPEISEEYFEWIDILQSALHSKNSYLMFEIGAGFGRWGLRAWKAAKLCGVKEPQIVCVEAEPDHANWIHLHFKKNQVPIENYKIVEAAISDEDGQADFFVQWPGWTREKSAREWYGQALAKSPWEGAQSIKVKTISVESLFAPYQDKIIDLIDIDIQGEEEFIVPATNNYLEKIKMIHIGTHSDAAEKEIKKFFESKKWFCANYYKSGELYNTEFGKIKFGDGVQTWINPKLYET